MAESVKLDDLDVDAEGLSIESVANAQLVVMQLVANSMWFCVEPWPDDEYLILVRRAEWPRLLKICRNLFGEPEFEDEQLP